MNKVHFAVGIPSNMPIFLSPNGTPQKSGYASRSVIPNLAAAKEQKDPRHLVPLMKRAVKNLDASYARYMVK